MFYRRAALLLISSTMGSTGCYRAAAPGGESAAVRVDQAPPEPPETPSADRTKSVASPVERTSLYGLSLVLPSGWHDESEVVFSSEAGPLLKLAFFVEPLSPAEVDEWMERVVREGNVPSRGIAAEIHRFDNPALSIRGLALRGAKAPLSGSNYTPFATAVATPGKEWIIAVEFDTHAVVAHPHCSEDCDQLLEIIFRSLRRAGEQSAPLEPSPVPGGGFLYRARQLEFESPLRLENPVWFRFEADDRRGELWCSRSSAEELFDGPEWHEDFDLESGAQVTEYAVEPLSASVFRGQRWFATVDEPEGRRELTYAEVSTRVESVTFQCVFQREGASRESAELLEAILASARRD